MAIIVAWWGIWHIIAGLITAFIFSRRPLPSDDQIDTAESAAK
jgi:BASS family bile acid:Na+ symporter